MIFLKAAQIFYEKLYSSSNQYATIDYFNEDIPSITTSEIRHAVNNFKKGKRPALEKIYSKDIIARGETLTTFLKHDYPKQKETQSRKRKRSYLCYVNTANYMVGTIVLLSHAPKLVMSVIPIYLKSDLYPVFTDCTDTFKGTKQGHVVSFLPFGINTADANHNIEDACPT